MARTEPEFLENTDRDKEKPRSHAGEALASFEKFGHNHPELETAVIAGAGIAAGLIANRFHIAGVVERFFPKAATLLGGGMEDLLEAHAASERLPKLFSRVPIAESFNHLGREFAAKPLVVSLDRVAEVVAKPEANFFAQPVLTENADKVASIFAKHMESPEWNALNRARSEAERARDAASENLLYLPEGTPYTSDREKVRALMLEHNGEEGLRRMDAADAASAHRNALNDQSSAPDRLPILQNAFDELSDSFSLPRVKVEFEKDLNAAGTYILGTDKVLIKQSHLEGENYASLFGTSAHELTHVEEITLVVRRIADKLRIGADATPEQMKILQDAYKAEIQLPLESNFASNILKVRNGRILSADENLRAEKISQGIVSDHDRKFQHHLDGHEIGKLLDLESDLRSEPAWRVLSEFHGPHLSPGSEIELEYEDSIRRYVRGKNPELDRLVGSLKIDETGQPTAWSADADYAARREISAFLEPRTDALRTLLEEHEKGYYAAFHEEEAHGTSDAIREAFNRLQQ